MNLIYWYDADLEPLRRWATIAQMASFAFGYMLGYISRRVLEHDTGTR